MKTELSHSGYYAFISQVDTHTNRVYLKTFINFQKSKVLYALIFDRYPEIYIYSAPNKSNETHTFMCLGRAGRFRQH